MKAVFLGNEDTITRVYTADVQKSLQGVADFLPGVYDAKAISSDAPGLAEAEFAFSSWGMPVLTEADWFAHMPKLQAVFYAAGSVQAFARPLLARGVRVFSAWGANGVPVAEYTVAQILLANKGFYQATRLTHQSGSYDTARAYTRSFPGTYGTEIGLIGAGMIGRLVIEKLHACGVASKILVFDPFLSEEEASRLGVEKTALWELFARCQTISNHLANNPQTVGMLNEDCFRRMKPNACFINTGRGAQVVESALVEALEAQPGRTAVLDVSHPEPPEPNHPFYRMPNVFLTPHIAGSLGDEVARMGQYMVEEYKRLLANEAPQWEVHETMLSRMA